MKNFLIGFAIVLLAFFFRFNNLNWDANFHLHPDERFLTMVGNAMKLPVNVNQYFNQKTSLLNPSNVGYNFFVYGRFPLILTKYLAVNFNLDNYNDLTILGRQLSAFFDLLIVLLVFKTVLLLEKHYLPAGRQVNFPPSLKYWASFFYAIAVLPIQLSHFFAVDTFLNFFMFASFYLSLKFYFEKKLKYLAFSAIFFGLALGCKVTAVFILPLNIFFIIFSYLKRPSKTGKHWLLLFFYLGISYFTLRLVDPYLFQSSNFLNPKIDLNFIANLKSLDSFANKDIWYPPSVQWLNKKPLQFSLFNLAMFGVGIPYFVMVIVGMASKKKTELAIIFFWVLAFFLYQGTRFNPAMRYFLIIYPFLAILAALGIDRLINDRFILNHFFNKKIQRIINSKKAHYLSIFFSIVVLLLWPIIFSSIYFHPHTRVEASDWIYKNLPANSVILGEYWDDPLPLPVINYYGKQFTIEQLPVFDPDTKEKWQKMDEMLQRADYYVLSSNRGWGSIMMAPEKYPQMSKFYDNLLKGICDHELISGMICFKKIKEFKPYYYRFFQLPNSWVDESFTVYDHPTVIIFKKTF